MFCCVVGLEYQLISAIIIKIVKIITFYLFALFLTMLQSFLQEGIRWVIVGWKFTENNKMIDKCIRCCNRLSQGEKV